MPNYEVLPGNTNLGQQKDSLPNLDVLENVSETSSCSSDGFFPPSSVEFTTKCNNQISDDQESACREAIRIAEASDWHELQKLVEKYPKAARETGSYGMLPLHWASTEKNVPISLLTSLLLAYPDGARTKNDANMLALHMAVRAKASPKWIKGLLDAYPDSIQIETPHGQTPLQLAKDVKLDALGVDILEDAEIQFMNGDPEKEWLNLSQKNKGDCNKKKRIGAENTKQHHDSQFKSRITEFSPISGSFDQVKLQRKFSLGNHSAGTTPTNKKGKVTSRHDSMPIIPSFDNVITDIESDDDLGEEEIVKNKNVYVNELFETPPEWRRDDECAICRVSFSMFKLRHHCRNCGKSICRVHSADKKIAMPSKGFTTPQRACVTCYAILIHPAYASSLTTQGSFIHSDPETISEYNYEARRSPDTISKVKRTRSCASDSLTMPTTTIALRKHVNDLTAMVTTLQSQVQTLTQSNINLQQQVLEQEELKAETMLLITDVMTRVSVLELQNQDNNHHGEDYDL